MEVITTQNIGSPEVELAIKPSTGPSGTVGLPAKNGPTTPIAKEGKPYVPRALGLSSPHTTDSPPSSPPPSPPRLQDAESPPADGSATYVALDEIAPAETVQKPVLAAEDVDRLRSMALSEELTLDTIQACITLFLCTETVSDEDRNAVVMRLKLHARSSEGRNLIMQTGCIPKIVYLLVDPGTVELAAALIVNLAYTHHESKSISAELIKGGVIQRLTWVLEFGSDSAKSSAINALANLVIGNNPRKDLLVRAGGFLQQLTRCLGSPSKSYGKNATRLFHTLAAEDKTISPYRVGLLATNGCAGAIAIGLNPEDTEYIKFVMPILYHILHDDATTFCKAFVRAGGDKKIVGLIDAYTNMFGIAKTGLDVIVVTLRRVSRRVKLVSDVLALKEAADADADADADTGNPEVSTASPGRVKVDAEHIDYLAEAKTTPEVGEERTSAESPTISPAAEEAGAEATGSTEEQVGRSAWSVVEFSPITFEPVEDRAFSPAEGVKSPTVYVSGLLSAQQDGKVPSYKTIKRAVVQHFGLDQFDECRSAIQLILEEHHSSIESKRLSETADEDELPPTPADAVIDTAAAAQEEQNTVVENFAKMEADRINAENAERRAAVVEEPPKWDSIDERMATAQKAVTAKADTEAEVAAHAAEALALAEQRAADMAKGLEDQAAAADAQALALAEQQAAEVAKKLEAAQAAADAKAAADAAAAVEAAAEVDRKVKEAAEKAANEVRLAAEKQAADMAKQIEEMKAAYEAKAVADAQAAAEASRKITEAAAKTAEASRLAAEKQAADMAKQIEEMKAAEMARIAANAKAAEEARVAAAADDAAAKQIEQARLASEQRAAEMAKQLAEMQAASAAKLQLAEMQAASAAKLAAEKLAADEAAATAAAAAEQQRIEAERKLDEARIAAAKDLAEVQAKAQAVEEARIAAELGAQRAARIATEQALQDKADQEARYAAQKKAAEEAQLQAEITARKNAADQVERDASEQRRVEAETKAAKMEKHMAMLKQIEADRQAAIAQQIEAARLAEVARLAQEAQLACEAEAAEEAKIAAAAAEEAQQVAAEATRQEAQRQAVLDAKIAENAKLAEMLASAKAKKIAERAKPVASRATVVGPKTSTSRKATTLTPEERRAAYDDWEKKKKAQMRATKKIAVQPISPGRPGATVSKRQPRKSTML